MINKLIRNRDTDISTYLFGRIPPQVREIEEAVLGAMMLEKEALSVVSKLRSEMFYVEAHQHIFKAMVELFNQGNPVDSLTVTDYLRSTGELENVGGIYFVAQLTNRVATSAHVEYHAKIVHQKFLQRELIRISIQATKGGYEDTEDVFDLIDGTVKELLLLTDVGSGKSVEPIDRIVATMAQIEKAMQNKNLTGIPSGFEKVDSFTGGWQKGDLIVIAGRPGSGKTAYAISLARAAAEYTELDENGKTFHPYPVYFFSLEMSNTQIGMRELAMDNGFKYSKLRTGRVSSDEFQQIVFGTDKMQNSPLYVDENPILNLTILRSKLIHAKGERKIEMCVIDYLNLMQHDSDDKYMSRYDKVSELTRGVKRIAKELKIPIIMLCQLNRDVERESKTDKRPKLHHLRDAGTIEEASDLVLMMYRPAYYFTDANFSRFDANNQPEENAFYVDFAKHKQGATGEIKLYTEIEKNIFYDWDRQPSKVNFKNITEPANATNGDNPF